MPTGVRLIAPADAWERISAHLPATHPQSLERRAALGRVLARDLAATVDVPFADVSAMDGYAVEGPLATPVRLPVAFTVAAGDPPGRHLPARAVAGVMTGATVPAGADRVVPVEDTDGGTEEVELRRVGLDGAHIRRRGEVLRRGELLLAAGTCLTPGGLGLLATHGYSTVEVHGAPTVAVLTTGDELVPPEGEPGPGQLRDSNTDFLLAAGATLGLGFESLGIAADDPDTLREKVHAGLERQVLLLCGGVSRGLFDFVEGVLEELGCTLLFDAVAIQPGKPLVAAHHAGGLVFGLPGNPASVMVAFWLFVRPALRRTLGLEDAFWHGALEAELAAPLPGAKGRTRYLPARVAFDDGRIRATPLPPHGSHDVAAYGQGSALVVVPPRSPERGPGDRCEVLPLADWPGDRPAQPG